MDIDVGCIEGALATEQVSLYYVYTVYTQYQTYNRIVYNFYHSFYANFCISYIMVLLGKNKK